MKQNLCENDKKSPKQLRLYDNTKGKKVKVVTYSRDIHGYICSTDVTFPLARWAPICSLQLLIQPCNWICAPDIHYRRED